MLIFKNGNHCPFNVKILSNLVKSAEKTYRTILTIGSQQNLLVNMVYVTPFPNSVQEVDYCQLNQPQPGRGMSASIALAEPSLIQLS